MYLVHVHLHPHPSGDLLPGNTAATITASTAEAEGIEHVSVHPHTQPHPVIGIYVQAATLEDAEEMAESVWRRASARHGRLREWGFARAEVPLLRLDAEWPP